MKMALIYSIVMLMMTSCANVQPTNYSAVAKVQAPVKAEKPKVDRRYYLSNKNPVPPAYNENLSVPDSNKRFRKAGGLNVSVHEVDARDFFMGLVVDTEENMVVHPDVKGTISLELKNVSIPQILDAVQKVYGYDYKKSDIGYVIYPATLQTKTFKISRLDLLREGKSETFVSSGQTGNSSSGYGNQQNQSQYPQMNNNQPNTNGAGVSRSSGSSITTSTQTDFWKELEDALHMLIAVDKEASVAINRQSGVVIARAKPMHLREIENFLNMTQNQISRQVILEAKILEVVLNDSHQDGVEWKSIIREGLQNAPILVGNPGTVFTLASRAGSFRAGDFTAVVTLLESQGKTNVLSSPRISTLNNQQAIIKVGRDETFVTGISPGLSGGGITNSLVQPAPILSAFFSGIALDVTPQINDNGSITLHIHPSITKVESLNREYTIGDQGIQSVPTALSTIRESDSVVKARDGQIVVLGGLMQDTIDENKEGVTGLSRIPVLGNLFRVNTGNRQKSELVILLKATVIDGDMDWEADREASEQRIKELDAQPRWQ